MKNKEIVRDVIKSFLTADIERALSHMTEDVKLRWLGYFDLEPGKDAIREFYKNVPELVSSELGDLIGEGDTIIGSGKMTARHESGKIENSYFCDIFKLENGMIKEIRSHVVFEKDNRN